MNSLEEVITAAVSPVVQKGQPFSYLKPQSAQIVRAAILRVGYLRMKRDLQDIQKKLENINGAVGIRATVDQLMGQWNLTDPPHGASFAPERFTA